MQQSEDVETKTWPVSATRYSSGKYFMAPLLYAGAIFDAFRRISLTVASLSHAPGFHLGACMKSSEGAGPGIGLRWEQVLVASPTSGWQRGLALRREEVLQGLCPVASWFVQRLAGPFFGVSLLSIFGLHI